MRIYDELDPEFKEHVDAVKNEFIGMKTDLAKLGWNILFPLIPLIGLVLLVIHALL